MRRGILLAAVLAFCGGALGCGGSDTTGPSGDRSKVAGVYHLATLTFDPHGSLPKVDILDRLATADRPELVLSRTNDTFQAITRDPESGRFESVEGKYTLFGTNGLRLSFKRRDDAQLLLLPQRAEFEFDETSMTLTYHANSAVSLTQLRNLVPEFQTEQLPDPVQGELVVVFTLDRR